MAKSPQSRSATAPAGAASMRVSLKQSPPGEGEGRVYVDDLPDYVERVVRTFVAQRAEGQTFAEWAHAADEEALQ